MKIALSLILVMLCACTKVYVPTAPTTSTPPPATPAPTLDKIEFRVFGSEVASPVTITYIDPLNGTTIINGSLPYFAEVTNANSSVFLFLSAQTFGFNSSSSLQVQIFVNGQLFREDSITGFTLLAQASGTFRR